MVEVDGRQVEIRRLDKVFFPRDGITKGDLVDYYLRVAEHALPHLRDRPITMHRFPDGLEGEGFYQKEVPDHFPDWIDRVTVEKRENGRQEQVMCNQRATLAFLAGQACITPHIWLSRGGRLNRPDKMVLDLDPPGDDFEKVREGALLLRDHLLELDLCPFVMTTGSRGLHLVIPLDGERGFESTRAVARGLVEELAARHPGELTTETRKDRRRGRLFLDYLRNAYGQTSVAPYAVRAREGAPVATPLDWEELERDRVGPRSHHVGNLFRRLGQKGDPWADFFERACSLEGL
ncbi:MAG: non-homologous end-joining DNA ligase [Methanomassiliicoccales archaeon]